MNSRFKLALAFLASMALAFVAVMLLGDDQHASRGTEIALEADAPSTDNGVRGGAPARLDGEGETDGGGATAGPGGAPGTSIVGARQPSGIDYSDPAVRESALRELMANQPVNWQEVSKIVGLMEEKIPDELRPALLNELKSGSRNQVMFVFAKLRDASFVEDLIAMLDDPSVIRGARRSVLTALWQMPGGDRDEIARTLEGRLTGTLSEDMEVFHAIARRGGPEAGRAMVEYLQRLTGSSPKQIPPHILRSLDVTDPKTGAVIAQALASESSPKVLGALITMASRAGAKTMVEPLMALDRDGMSNDVRSRAIAALGTIADVPSVNYLLRKAEEPGMFGERAIAAISRINTSSSAVAEALTKALAGADNSPRPVETKVSILTALGNTRARGSLQLVAKAMDDPNAKVRLAAIQAMGQMGHRSRGYITKLANQYDSGDEMTKRRIAIALGTIGGEEAVVQMRRMLESKRLSPSLKQTLQLGLRNAQRELKEAGTPVADAR